MWIIDDLLLNQLLLDYCPITPRLYFLAIAGDKATHRHDANLLVTHDSHMHQVWGM